jgi:hypothetical protein
MREAKQRAARRSWAQEILEGLLALPIIGGVVIAAGSVVTNVTGPMTSDVGLREGAARLPPPEAGRITLAADQAIMTIGDPTAWQRLVVIAPTFVGGVVMAVVAWLLFKVARSFRRGDPFRPQNVRSMRAAAVIAAAGGMLAVFAYAVGHMEWSGAADDAGLPVTVGAVISFEPVLIGLAIGLVAEVFARAAVLSKELEGVV